MALNSFEIFFSMLWQQVANFNVIRDLWRGLR